MGFSIKSSMPTGLADGHFCQLLAVRAHHVGGAGQAGVERVQRAQDLDRLLRVDHGRVHQAGFEGADLALVVARLPFQVVGTTHW